MLRTFIVAFLALNALFWGLFPHRSHCAFVAALGVAKCPAHSVHIAIGAVAFALAVLTAQWHHFTQKH